MSKLAEEVDEIFSLLSQSIPDAKIELDYINPFTLFVAVVLSAQSTDKMVNKITPSVFAIADSPEKMCNLGKEKLKSYIKSIGLYNNKADNILKSSAIMVAQHNNDLPKTFEELIKLPGVGRKSANVILNALFGAEVIAVDTHVFRTSNRIGLCQTKNPLATEKALDKIIDSKWKKIAHHLLVLHGRYTCKARSPLCIKCPIEHLCDFIKY